MWIPGQSGRDGDCPPGSRGEDIGGRMRGMRQQEVRASEGQYSELMKKREGAAGSSILTQPGAPECSRSRLSLPLLKDDDNFSSSHRGHSLLQIIQFAN